MDVRIACRCVSTMAWTAGLRERIREKQREDMGKEREEREGREKEGRGKETLDSVQGFCS